VDNQAAVAQPRRLHRGLERLEVGATAGFAPAEHREVHVARGQGKPERGRADEARLSAGERLAHQPGDPYQRGFAPWNIVGALNELREASNLRV
jgi:hypothetical protein